MSDHVVNDLEFYNPKVAVLLLPNTIFLIISCALSVIGNIIVMHIHWRKLHSHENYRRFIPYLALSDCIGSVVCSCISTIHNYIWLSWSNAISCKLGWALVKSILSVCITFLVIIAAQRYIRICRPLQAKISAIAKVLCFLACCAYVLFEGAPVAFFAGIYEINTTMHNVTFFECRRVIQNNNLYLVYTIIESSVCCLVIFCIIVLYFLSGRKLAKVSKRVSRNTLQSLGKLLNTADLAMEFKEESSITTGGSVFYSAQAGSTNNLNSEDVSVSITNYGTNRAYKKMKARNKKYSRINCMFIIISIIMLLTYLPRVVISIFEAVYTDFWNWFIDYETFNDYNLLIMLSVNRLYMVSFFINPIVYSVMDTEFRRELKLCLCFR